MGTETNFSMHAHMLYITAKLVRRIADLKQPFHQNLVGFNYRVTGVFQYNLQLNLHTNNLPQKYSACKNLQSTAHIRPSQLFRSDIRGITSDLQLRQNNSSK